MVKEEGERRGGKGGGRGGRKERGSEGIEMKKRRERGWREVGRRERTVVRKRERRR